MSGARLRKSVPAVPPPVPVDPDAPPVTPPTLPVFTVTPDTHPAPQHDVPQPLAAPAPMLPPPDERVDPFAHGAELVAMDDDVPVTVEGIVMPDFPSLPEFPTGDPLAGFLTAATEAMQAAAESDDPNDRLDEIDRKIAVLIDAVNTVGLQNQWMVETVTKMFGMFEQFMGSGNPMAMLGNLMGMRRNQKRGKNDDAAND